MAATASSPPGLPRPHKKKLPPSPLPLSQGPPPIFSPAPSQPRTDWFQLLGSPSPLPAPLMSTAPAAYVEPSTQPHTVLSQVTAATHAQPKSQLLSSSKLFDNASIVSNIATVPSSATKITASDPWARAHMRVCAHAHDECAACSISLTCCSCRALRYTPGPPPVSPTTALTPIRSRSASPTLFRNVGNGSPPPDFDTCHDQPYPDDDAYARALAECDTCDNSSCPRGVDEPASWTITVTQFDEGLEEFYDRTFRLCSACNRSCKKSFLGHKIKARQLDNSSKFLVEPKPDRFDNAVRSSPSVVPLGTTAVSRASTPPPPSRPPTPLEVFSTVSYAHRASCNHAFSTCPTCSLGILCCGCNKLHTAPARLRLRCSACSHFACGTCITPYCCACRKPWFPGDSPTLLLASRPRGGARSTKSSKKGSSSSSQSSGPGSLATAHSERNSPDPFAAAAVPQITQSSTDEIDAFADRTVKVSALIGRDNNAPTAARSANAPSPSSNLLPGPSSVFSRPEPPIIVGVTEDVPTAVPSRAPSRAASVASAASTGDTGIGELLQPDPMPAPADPPSFADVVGRIHRRYPLASLKVNDEDSRHFLARDNTRVEDIANETEYLLSSNSSWPTLLYFLRDTLKFESIRGPIAEFQVLLAGLAEIWSDAADFDARTALRDMVESVRLLPKAEKEIDRLEGVAARYRNERQAARTQLKTTEVELSRLRQAANDTLDSNARLLTKIDQLQSTDAIAAIRERDEARSALQGAIAQSKTTLAKQLARYQQLTSVAEERNARLRELEKDARDKDAYILKTEREHAEIYREREAAERRVAAIQQQLQDATTLFETAREERRHDQLDFEERVVAFKAHISDLNAKLNMLPAGEAELRSIAALANERAGIAEEEYRKKSAELKTVQKELAALKALRVDTDKQAKPSPPAGGKSDASKPKVDDAKSAHGQSAKKVRWGFEPPDDSSQPFWDHTNEYSRYIANMVAATVSALPNIPMQTAISTAIETVRAAGPNILSQTPTPKATSGHKRPPSPNPSPPANPAQRSRAPSPSPPKPNAAGQAKAKAQAEGPKPVPAAAMTFAQMAASVLDPPAAAPMHPAKAKPTWRAIETNKSLVLRPGTKGTR
ncbi:hypothetical protein AX14_005152, partial [Amanita brunnescens Koide BX004]